MVTCLLASADPILLGAIGKTLLGGGGVDETHLSVFHSGTSMTLFTLNKKKEKFF